MSTQLGRYRSTSELPEYRCQKKTFYFEQNLTNRPSATLDQNTQTTVPAKPAGKEVILATRAQICRKHRTEVETSATHTLTGSSKLGTRETKELFLVIFNASAWN